MRRPFPDTEHLRHGAVREPLEQIAQLPLGPGEIVVMPEFRLPAGTDARLPRVYLPGVQVEHRGFPLAPVDPFDPPPYQRHRQQPEVTSAGDGKLEAPAGQRYREGAER